MGRLKGSFLKAFETLAFGLFIVLVVREPEESWAYHALLGMSPNWATAFLPHQFHAGVKTAIIVPWIMFASIVHGAVSYDAASYVQLRKEVAKFTQGQFNRLAASLVQNGQEILPFESPEFHKASRVATLDAIRQSLHNGYWNSDLHLTFMVPHADSKLHVECFANVKNAKPKASESNFGFRKMEGFAGYAWAKGEIQVGYRYLVPWLRLIPDVRHIKTPGDDGQAQAFFAYPLFEFADGEEHESFLGVICISSEKRSYFPRRSRPLNEFFDALAPLFRMFVLHILLERRLEGALERPVERRGHERRTR